MDVSWTELNGDSCQCSSGPRSSTNVKEGEKDMVLWFLVA